MQISNLVQGVDWRYSRRTHLNCLNKIHLPRWLFLLLNFPHDIKSKLNWNIQVGSDDKIVGSLRQNLHADLT